MQLKIALIVMIFGVAVLMPSYAPDATWAQNRVQTYTSRLAIDREDGDANWRSVELTPLLYRALVGR